MLVSWLALVAADRRRGLSAVAAVWLLLVAVQSTVLTPRSVWPGQAPYLERNARAALARAAPAPRHA